MVKTKNQDSKKPFLFGGKLRAVNLLMLTLAGAVNAFGITVFLSPVRLYDSGASGVSMLLSQLTPGWMSLSLFLLLINIPLFLYGLKRQGPLFTVYAMYSVLIYSLCAWLITDVFPIDVSTMSPLAGQDLLLCACFGGFLSGIGSGTAIRFGGAMDGVEVLAVIFAKKLGITVGNFMMLFNLVLYITCGMVIQSWILPLYSIVTYMVALRTVDYVVEGIDRAKAIHIITEKEREVCQVLSESFSQGITVSDGRGFYSNKKKAIVYLVLNRFQIPRMKELVFQVDPQAYISINEVSDVFKASR